MIGVLLIFGGIVLALLTRLAIRRRRPATPWRRRGWTALAGTCGLLTPVFLAAGGYGYWYEHRTQPPPTQRTLFEGIEYAREVRQSPRLMVIHVGAFDLSSPGVAFMVTPGQPTGGQDLPARKTSAFLEEFNVQLAVNANYFYPFRSEAPWDYFPHAGDGVSLCGFAASRGAIYSNKKWRPGTLYISEKNEASFDAPIGAIYNAISGGGYIVRGGKVQPPPLIADEKDQPYPRAAVGLTKDRRTLVFVMIDGKQPGHSKGATLGELGQVMIEQGCDVAVRLDEGGSCAMAAEGADGRAELLNVPINNRIPYRERVVGNHLGVFARRR